MPEQTLSRRLARTASTETRAGDMILYAGELRAQADAATDQDHRQWLLDQADQEEARAERRVRNLLCEGEVIDHTMRHACPLCA